MRKVLIVSADTPRPVRYSRARAASGAFNCASKYCVAASCRSISCRRSPDSRASSGELNSCFGSGIPVFCATARTASGKLRPSIFMTKVYTSPVSWQPKQ
jgi:hypothetical protein